MRIWDVGNGNELARLSRLDGFPEIIVWSLDGTRIAAVSMRGQIVVWDWREGQRLATMSRGRPYPEPYSWPIMFSPDGKELLYLDAGKAYRYDIVQKQIINTFVGDRGLSAVQYSPRGLLLATVDDFGKVEVRDLDSQNRRTIVAGDDQPRTICFADEKTLAVAQLERVTFHNLETGKVSRTIKTPKEHHQIRKGIYMASPFTYRARHIIVHDADSVVVIDLSSQKKTRWKRSVNAHYFNFSDDGRSFALIDGGVNLYSPNSERVLRSFGIVNTGRRNVNLLAGRYLQFRDGAWDLQSGNPETISSNGFVDASNKLRVIAGVVIQQFSRVGNFAREQREVPLESAGEYVQSGEHRPWVRVQWTRDGRRVFGVSRDQKTLRVWDASTGRIAHDFRISDGATPLLHAGLLAVNADGTMVVFAEHKRVHKLRHERGKTLTTTFDTTFDHVLTRRQP